MSAHLTPTMRHAPRHGHAREGQRTPTYNTWGSMRGRTSNPNNPKYPSYGGRGITVCERWAIFENFLADMGERPTWATGGLDRIDNDGNYEPGNCRWATSREQMLNRRPLKLTLSERAQIASDIRSGTESVRAIAARYGVSSSMVYRVRSDAGIKVARVPPPATHCPRGHAYDEVNTYVTSAGGRRCRECTNAGQRARYRKAT